MTIRNLTRKHEMIIAPGPDVTAASFQPKFVLVKFLLQLLINLDPCWFIALWGAQA